MGEIKDFVHMYIQDSDILEEATNELAMNLENYIKIEAPYDQGRLRRSIRVVSLIYVDYAIVHGYFDAGVAPHGIYVLTGTRPHPITFTNRWGTKTTVQHPGTKPNDFLGRGLQRTMRLYQ